MRKKHGHYMAQRGGCRQKWHQQSQGIMPTQNKVFSYFNPKAEHVRRMGS